MPRIDEGTRDPNLYDENWRAFSLAKEANSALAKKDWTRYRQGLRRLEREYEGRVPRVPLRRALAEDAFFCATHWKRSRRIVQGALSSLLEHPLGVNRYTFAAAEYWKWAAAVSPPDLPEGERMIKHAREAMKTADDLTQVNLKRMLAVVTAGPAGPSR